MLQLPFLHLTILIKVRNKDVSSSSGINPQYNMSVVESFMFNAKIPISPIVNKEFGYPINSIEIQIMTEEGYIVDSIDLDNESYYHIEGGMLYLTKTFEEFASSSKEYQALMERSPDGAYFTLHIEFKRFVALDPDVSSEQQNKYKQLALLQANHYAVMDVMNQYTFGETTANMIAEVGYTEVLTLVSTACTLWAIALDSWSTAGLQQIGKQVSEKVTQVTFKTFFSTLKTAMVQSVTKSLVAQMAYTILLTPIKEAVEEIVMDGLIEGFFEGLVDCCGGSANLGFWLSTLATTARETNLYMSFFVKQDFGTTTQTEVDTQVDAAQEFYTNLDANTDVEIIQEGQEDISGQIEENTQTAETKQEKMGEEQKSIMDWLKLIGTFTYFASSLFLGGLSLSGSLSLLDFAIENKLDQYAKKNQMKKMVGEYLNSRYPPSLTFYSKLEMGTEKELFPKHSAIESEVAATVRKIRSLPFKFESADSMKGTAVAEVGEGTIMARMEGQTYEKETIIAFEKFGKIIIHRVMERIDGPDGTYYRTKGDANERVDLDPVPESKVLGKVREDTHGTPVYALPTLPAYAMTNLEQQRHYLREEFRRFKQIEQGATPEEVYGVDKNGELQESFWMEQFALEHYGRSAIDRRGLTEEYKTYITEKWNPSMGDIAEKGNLPSRVHDISMETYIKTLKENKRRIGVAKVRGWSMFGKIKPGSKIAYELKQEGEEYEIGDIIAYYLDGVYVVHEIVGTYCDRTQELHYITKGVNNPKMDAKHVSDHQVVGKVVDFSKQELAVLIEMAEQGRIPFIEAFALNEKKEREIAYETLEGFIDVILKSFDIERKALSSILFNDENAIQKTFFRGTRNKIVENLRYYILTIAYKLIISQYEDFYKFDINKNDFNKRKEGALLTCQQYLESQGLSLEYLGWEEKEYFDSKLHKVLNRIINNFVRNGDLEPRSLTIVEANDYYKNVFLSEIDNIIEENFEGTWRYKSRLASHLRILFRILTRDLMLDGGIRLTRAFPIKPWGFYVRKNAISIINDRGIELNAGFEQKSLAYILEYCTKNGIGIEDVFEATYYGSFRYNPVHDRI